MNYPDNCIHIDYKKCNNCGLCIKACVTDSLYFENGKVVFCKESCFNCGHCISACPQKAISHSLLSDPVSSFNTFIIKKNWLPYGKFEIEKLASLMLSRRSVRNYQDKKIDIDVLNDLINLAIYAPSAKNIQPWNFLIIPTREKVENFALKILDYFKKLNSLAENVFLRAGLSFLGKKELSEYYDKHYFSIKNGIKKFEEEKKDLLFHSAPAVIIISADKTERFGKDDVLLATQNILLAAHAIGLGSCLIGFAVEALKKEKKLMKFLEIPANHMVYSVIALGYPEEPYHELTGRKPVSVRVI